jgi:hypothetical protein
MEIEDLGRVADAGRDFVWQSENWQIYELIKAGRAASNIVLDEFLKLCRLVEESYGPRPKDWEG